MVRLGSDVLPVYTEPTWSYYWRLPDVRAYCEKNFAPVRETARVPCPPSTHPSPLTVPMSDNEEIVERSIEEFEYPTINIWVDGIRAHLQDFKCNVHISVGKVQPVLNTQSTTDFLRSEKHNHDSKR